jgi:hypothetical protein
MMNLLAELKRRNVIRMAGLYLLGAWLILAFQSESCEDALSAP